VGVLVDTWGYLSADCADLEDYADNRANGNGLS